MLSSLDIIFIRDTILSFYLPIIQSVQSNLPCPGYIFFSRKLGPGIFFRKIFLPPPPIKIKWSLLNIQLSIEYHELHVDLMIHMDRF